MPDLLHQLNHKSAMDNAVFVATAIDELVAAQCVVECATCPIVTSQLSVVLNGKGKPRLVLDLRYVNQFLPDHKFKYEGLSLVPSLFQCGDFFSAFDLKSGYHHVDIHKDFWPYLGFCWGRDHSKKWFTFRVLPFGLSTACYVFTKLIPLVKRWRSMGLRCIVYIDDGICASGSRQQCTADTQQIVDDLALAGFVLNRKKSCLEPQLEGVWLGFLLDLLKGMFCVPQEKVLKLNSSESIDGVLQSKFVCAHTLASITGQIISMGLAVGPVSWLCMRALYCVLNKWQFWSNKLPLDGAALDELAFWKSSLPSFNGQPIWFSPGAIHVVFSYASSTGYGGYSVEIGPDIAQGQWSEYEASLSSTWRELKAVSLVLASFATKLAGHRVKWFTDNQSVVRIVEAGSGKQHLQCIALNIIEMCFKHGIHLDIDWIPRSLNDKAD